MTKTTPRTRVALVTGCAKENGIGRAIADVLSSTFKVVVTDVASSGVANSFEETQGDDSWKGLSSVVEAIQERGGEAASVMGDVSDPDDCERMVEEARRLYGSVDVLVNNAGAPQGADIGEIDEIPIEAWDRMMSINVRGVFLMTRAVVPSMREGRWGRIVSIASIAGLVGRPRIAAYSASKAAVIGFTKSVALDLAPLGITVNAVCPGSVQTSRAYAAARRAGAEDVDASLEARARQIPVGRYGQAADIAAAVAYLTSEQASYVTGHALTVDGGEVRV
jgi:3-oxoacyl-[acyl-carrier protein] reductase